MERLKMCRACLLPENRVHLLDWYQPMDSLEYGLSYKECFCECTQINLCLKDVPYEKDDGQTHYLCILCAKKLKDAHDFIEKAKEADHKLHSMRIDKQFEWVSVNVKDVDTDKMVEPAIDKNCLGDINIWQDHSTDVKRINVSNNIDRGDITDANLRKELEKHFLRKKRKTVSKTKHKENGQNSEENTKSYCDEEFMDETGMVLPNDKDDESCSDININKIKNKTRKRNALSKKSKKNSIKMDELLTCEVCAKTMTRKTLRKHKQRHKPKTVLCHACPKIFRDSNALKSHELTHKEERERYPCDKCNQTFLSPCTYRKHLQTHEINRKPIYKCTQCEKSFLQKSTLITHQLYHQGANIECNVCHKLYVRQIDLKVHLRTHSGEYSFRCNICGKLFIDKRILNKHMQHHDGFFRYTCLTCGEQFSKYNKYYAHRMQHTGLPFQCGICEKQFRDSYKIKRHIKGVHKIAEANEIEKLSLKVNETKEHRGRIVEVLKNPEDIEHT